MTEPETEQLRLTYDDAEAMWDTWAGGGEDDLLVRAAFDRTLRWTLGLEDEGLYFRPGGWTVDLPATVVRIACAAGLLAASFHLAGLEDLDREILIAAAGLVSAMNVRPVRITADDRLLVERIRDRSLTELPVTPRTARKALRRSDRKQVTHGQIEEALERLVATGIADRTGTGEYVVRAAGSEAWLRVSLGGPTP